MKTTALPVYSAALFLSAFLLFSVQPMLAKMLLPLLGGTPMVWNTAMVFFQTMLLLGYAYAHAVARFVSPRIQSFVQMGLLLLALLALPFAIGTENAGGPPTGSSPMFWQLGVMLVSAGAPFFVLSASAPMLQHWFTATAHDRSESPYFLYAASNAGSMLALLCYPFAIEPLWNLETQSRIWAGGYILLIVLTAVSALLVRDRKDVEKEREDLASIPEKDAPTTCRQRTLWLALSFVPSSLMLGVTTTITTDIASAPLLWVVPLALYVGTFIVAFAHKPPVHYQWALYFQTFALAALLCIVVSGWKPLPIVFLGFHLALFTFTALVCHLKLAELRPNAKRLTEFYLILSFGGVLGGIFNTLLAPILFASTIEYNLALIAAILLRFPFVSTLDPVRFLEGFRKNNGPVPLSTWGFLFFLGALPPLLVLMGWMEGSLRINVFAGLLLVPALVLVNHYRLVFAVVAIAPLILYPGLVKPTLPVNIFKERDFFGILRVADSPENIRYLIHGTTLHGGQSIKEVEKKIPLTYFYFGSSVGDIFTLLDERPGSQKIAGLGLGVGSIACYPRQGRDFYFYEIDPLVIKVAKDPHYFTFLSECGSPYKILQGDGRLEIAKAPDSFFDMIFLDVFSSDNIPVHVMTREAIEIYKGKLKPDGILVMNLSNRYLDLIRITAETAQTAGFKSLYRIARGGKIEGTSLWYSDSIFGVFALDEEEIASLKDKGWKPATPDPGSKPWTDGYANLVRALRFGDYKL